MTYAACVVCVYVCVCVCVCLREREKMCVHVCAYMQFNALQSITVCCSVLQCVETQCIAATIRRLCVRERERMNVCFVAWKTDS